MSNPPQRGRAWTIPAFVPHPAAAAPFVGGGLTQAHPLSQSVFTEVMRQNSINIT